MNELKFPVPTSALAEYLPHRPPMVWVDEVVSCSSEAEGPAGVCRVQLEPSRHFYAENGTVRTSAVVEWIAQAYGYMKACHRFQGGHGISGFGRAFLVGITDGQANLEGIEKEGSVLVHVKETRNLQPAYILEGFVTSEDGKREFGRARLKVFGS